MEFAGWYAGLLLLDLDLDLACAVWERKETWGSMLRRAERTVFGVDGLMERVARYVCMYVPSVSGYGGVEADGKAVCALERCRGDLLSVPGQYVKA